MAVSESAKHDLYQELERLLGKERAETFMNMVTTVPWSEVATKSDVRAEVERMGRRITVWTSSMMVALAALAFTAGRLV